MVKTIQDNIVFNAGLIGSIFSKEHMRIIEISSKLYGDKDDMLVMLCLELGIPVNQQTITILQSILLESTNKSHCMRYTLE